MSRTDTIREIAAICRRSNEACLAAIGWLILETPTPELEALLVVVDETAKSWSGKPSNHLEAFHERYGQYPQQ